MQGVGFARSTNEAGNDGGGKGRTCKPFLGQNISHTGGGALMASPAITRGC